MYEDLKGKTALVTGAGKRTGIGFAIAAKMTSCGANVIIADLGKGPESVGGVKMGMRQEMQSIASSLAEKYGVKTLALDLDVTSNDSIQQMIQNESTHRPNGKKFSPQASVCTLGRISQRKRKGQESFRSIKLGK